MTKVKFKSPVKESLHDLASGLFAVGAIDKQTMRGFDDSCLVSVPAVEPQQIRALRDREKVSQSTFAYHLNVTPGLVSQWERGEKKPSGPSLKLLSLVERKGLEAII
jgi:putative transcriptional regulator